MGVRSPSSAARVTRITLTLDCVLPIQTREIIPTFSLVPSAVTLVSRICVPLRKAPANPI